MNKKLINKKRLKFSGKDLNINFQLNSKNDIIINSLNNLVENVGNSLINPIIDEEVAQTFEIPPHWKLRAQLVFGSIEAPAGEKTFMDDAERFKTFA